MRYSRHVNDDGSVSHYIDGAKVHTEDRETAFRHSVRQLKEYSRHADTRTATHEAAKRNHRAGS